ncbi:hypothetical protein A5710_21950 [Mycolicibacter sinensis]|uniref:Uncharacterized protein n=2 Tax=Mycolicibacter TaxID=1073531 RepID=A0A1A2XUI7_MYCSD|nr:hypothetical protein A5694_21855 [Mycolicibacter sinensis]OBI29410.1 hypothetical protein A5710_21950 [Mycolicibacter sinensis]
MKEVSRMTTDTLTAHVLDEAERIVRAEWLQLLTAPEHCYAVRTEMPATRLRTPKLALCSAGPARPGAPPPARRAHRSATRRRNTQVWPTQRSPPDARRMCPPAQGR